MILSLPILTNFIFFQTGGGKLGILTEAVASTLNYPTKSVEIVSLYGSSLAEEEATRKRKLKNSPNEIRDPKFLTPKKSKVDFHRKQSFLSSTSLSSSYNLTKRSWHESGGGMILTPSRTWSTVWISIRTPVSSLVDSVKLRGLLGLHVQKVNM